MKILASLALALLLGGGAAWAREAMPLREKTQKKHMGMIHHENGTVVALNAVSGKLSVRDNYGKVTIFSAKKAKIAAAEGKSISLSDISIGDEVSIAYKGKEAIEVMRLRRAARR